MATSYKKSDTLAYFNTGNNWSTRLGYDTYSVTRGFVKFDTSAITADYDDVTAIDLVMNVQAVIFSGDTYICKSAISTDDNWGTGIDASLADFTSSKAHNEGTADCTTTGTKTFSISKANVDFSGTTWFRLQALNAEWAYMWNVLVQFSSIRNTTASIRPKLVITYTEAGVTYTQVIICTT